MAESYCARQLRRDDLDPRARTELLVDLSRVHAEQALNAAPLLREPLWAEAHDVLENGELAIGDESLRQLLRRQDALVHLARGRQLRQEAVVVADPAPLLEKSKGALRRAVLQLDETSRAVEKLLVERSRGGTSKSGTLDADELLALARDLKYQQAEALRNQGLAYPRGDRDRRNALAGAAEQFRPLAERASPIDWASLLGLVQSLREADQLEEAAALLAKIDEHIEKHEPPAATAMEFQLEAARLEIDREQLDRALAILNPGPPVGAEQTAAWDYELLVALLRQWRQAAGTTAENDWQAKANDQVRLLEARHSPYWRRRAESLLGSMVAASPGTADLEVLLRAAQSYYRSGKIDEAKAAYKRAYEQAKSAKLDDRAFDIGFTLASIDHDRKHYAAAAEMYRQLALGHAGNSQAARVHLLAIYNAAQLLRGKPNPDAEQYVMLMKEHLGRWPRDATTDRVRVWLGRYHQQRREWDAAIEAFTAVRPASDQMGEAVERAAASYRAWLAALAGDDKQRRKVGAEGADFFESIVLGENREWPAEFTPLQRQAAIASAKFRVQFAEADYSRTEKLLRAALARSPGADAEWHSTVGTWLVFSLALQPNRIEEAEQALSEVAGAGRGELLTLLQGLSIAARDAPPAASARLARLQLRVTEQLRRDATQLSKEDALRIAKIEAEALRATGQAELATAAFAKIVDDFPNDGALQAAYAELLLSGDSKQQWQQALVRWREVERRSKPDSARWYEAKLAQAAAHEKLGNCEQAARIVRLTKVLHPELGGRTMREQFEALLQRCE